VFKRILFRCILALVLWTVLVSIYAWSNGAGDKTPVLLAASIGLFAVPFSVVLMIWGLIKAIRGGSEMGMPTVMAGALLLPIAFFLYLISAVVVCG
jgi:hypothetical protein